MTEKKQSAGASSQSKPGVGAVREKKINLVLGDPDEVTAVVTRACRKCNAPGVWQSFAVKGKNSAQISDMEKMYQGWPKVFLPLESPLVGRSVGDKCPCCGESREGLVESEITIFKREKESA